MQEKCVQGTAEALLQQEQEPAVECLLAPPAEEGEVPGQEVEGLALAPSVIAKMQLHEKHTARMHTRCQPQPAC